MKTLLLSFLSLFLFISCDIEEEVLFGSISEEEVQEEEVQQYSGTQERSKQKSTYANSVTLKVDAVLEKPNKTDKVDIVFYIDGHVRSGRAKGFKRCLVEFGESVYRSGFLYQIDKTLDWQASFSSFSAKEAKRGRLERSATFFKKNIKHTLSWSRQDVLKKGENDRFVYDHVMYHSLTPLQNGRYRLGADRKSYFSPRKDLVYDAPRGSWKGKKDPLAGLDYFLTNKDNVRLDAKVIVFIIAHSDFPYSNGDLKWFADKHKGVTFYSLTAPGRKHYVASLNRLAKISGGGWKSLCENSGIGSQITQAVLNSVK